MDIGLNSAHQKVAKWAAQVSFESGRDPTFLSRGWKLKSHAARRAPMLYNWPPVPAQRLTVKF